MIDFRNINTVWASVLVETLQRIGLTTAILCPGSRSAPLTVAFAQHSKIASVPILDERSAAFFALGIARRSGRPTVIVCTSGTAAANFYPAIIEAAESCVPILVLTADRPLILRNCHAGQTIDQVKLYGQYPNWQTELELPSVEINMLAYLRQTTIYAWERSLQPYPGIVHLNLPFHDPLAPTTQAETMQLEKYFPENFFAAIPWSLNLSQRTKITSGNLELELELQRWKTCKAGLIIAGVDQPKCPESYCEAIGQLTRTLHWPVLAEGLSPLRSHNYYYSENIISAYDLILRNSNLAKSLIPEVVIQIGNLPTSKQLRSWLSQSSAKTIILDPNHQNLDSLHRSSIHLRISIEQFVETLFSNDPDLSPGSISPLISEKSFPLESVPALPISTPSTDQSYLDRWQQAESEARSIVNQAMQDIDELMEPKIAWLLPQILPQKTSIFIANSMPVRDVEFFWQPNSKQIYPHFNRGANGIDGTLSTALGMAYGFQNNVLLTGDLALLHDTNGLLLRQKFEGQLTIILINNDGGGIFEMLPIAQFDPPFEAFFATPQTVDFRQLCATYQIPYHQILSWSDLEAHLNPLPQTGIQVLEIQTNRKLDALWRFQLFDRFREI
ncbi:MAG: 2-succinyl-5-enolpyruvyl-6-hydroxy-3-cyclohexene-1-carboxylic-acid synthase [Microcoleaceae cyanobacterium]